MLLRFFIILGLTVGGLSGAAPAGAQGRPADTPRPLPAPAASAPAALPVDSSLFATYTYQSYLIYDQESGPEAIVAEGVGGTLTLRPDGRFEQRLRLGLPPQTAVFERSGEYRLAGEQISFSYLTRQGQPRTDTGRFRYDARQRALVITLDGYPAGNRSVYTLLAGAPAAP